jgi:Fe-S oxidoreductase
LIGFVNEVKMLAEKTTEQIKETGAKTIVVLNPSAARMFKQQYAGWGLVPAKEIVTVTSYFDKLIKDKKLSPTKQKMPQVTFHDPCRLARDLDETEPARDIIESMGLELSEMFYNKKMTKCCGGEVINGHSPNLTELTVKRRWKDAGRTKAKVLITACTGCNNILGEYVPADMQIKDLYVLLQEACKA